jgi:DNA-binding response OmpR family regulator
MTVHKILIVDDDPGIISNIVEALEETGWTIFAANNGEAAFQIACNEQPDLILLDWSLPEINGLDIVKKLKSNKITNQILIIMITGIMTNTEDMLIAYEMGVVDFMRKPFNKLELLARTRAVLKLAEYYKEKIEQKNKELVISALKAVELNQMISEITNIISESSRHFAENDYRLYQEFVKLKGKIDSKFHSRIWKQFEEHFMNVVPGFYQNLLQKYYNITAAELKLCSLIRLNLSTSEIATILSQEYDSVKVSRSRLRKKFNLNRDANLSIFLLQF